MHAGAGEIDLLPVKLTGSDLRLFCQQEGNNNECSLGNANKDECEGENRAYGTGVSSDSLGDTGSDCADADSGSARGETDFDS